MTISRYFNSAQTPSKRKPGSNHYAFVRKRPSFSRGRNIANPIFQFRYRGGSFVFLAISRDGVWLFRSDVCRDYNIIPLSLSTTQFG